MNRRKIIERIIENLYLIGRRIAEKKSHLSDKVKITLSQIRVLWLIEENEPVSVKNLAEKLGISGSATTQIVNSLVNTGFLLRKRSPSDRRLLEIVMAEKSKKEFELKKEVCIKIFSEIFSNLDNKEIRKYKNLNAKIIEKGFM